MSISAASAKKAPFELIYWDGIPGRAEFIRLVLEYAEHPYTESANVVPLLANPKKSGNPAHFAPPILRLHSGDYISQTPNIIHYLAPRLGLAGEAGSKILASTEEEREASEIERAKVNQLVLTALDLTNESHDVHHPISVMLYYEDQLVESKRRAEDFRESRMTKFLNLFNTVAESNAENGGTSGYLVGSRTTTADLVLFQVLCGLEYAFPKRVGALKKRNRYPKVWELQERVEKEKSIASYLASSRRREFSMGIFRHYPELDEE